MDEATKQAVLERKDALIQMVIERARRDFPEDIALIGLTGSFQTGDFHEKSDLDLVIVNETPRGWDMAFCFLLGDVGYDIYCTPWEPRIQAQSTLESPMVSHLLDLQILYCAKPEYLERFNAYREKALEALRKPIGRDCLTRAKRWIDEAKRDLASALLEDAPGPVRYATGGVLYNLINALVQMNNTYLKRGIKRYWEDVSAYGHLPENFETLYWGVVRAKTVEDLRASALALLKGVTRLHAQMWDQFVDKPAPTYENLRGTYEELWCNYRNKVLASTASGDASYALHAALGAQNYLDEMAEDRGTPRFDLLKDFEAENLTPFRDAFLRAMEEYLKEYDRVGRKLERFETLEDLSAWYLRNVIP